MRLGSIWYRYSRTQLIWRGKWEKNNGGLAALSWMNRPYLHICEFIHICSNNQEDINWREIRGQGHMEKFGGEKWEGKTDVNMDMWNMGKFRPSFLGTAWELIEAQEKCSVCSNIQCSFCGRQVNVWHHGWARMHQAFGAQALEVERVLYLAFYWYHWSLQRLNNFTYMLET